LTSTSPGLPPLALGVTASVPVGTTQRSNRSKWTVGLIVVIVAVGIVVALVAKRSSTVTVTLQDIAYNTVCADAQTNKDLYAGNTVNVTGDNGTQIARGVLDASTDSTTPSGGSTIDTCTFTAKLSVPSNQQTYSFSSVPGKNVVAFTHKELVNDNWVAGITTGAPQGSGNTGSGNTGNS